MPDQVGAGTLGELVVNFKADTKQFEEGAKKASQLIGDISQEAKTLGESIEQSNKSTRVFGTGLKALATAVTAIPLILIARRFGLLQKALVATSGIVSLISSSLTGLGLLFPGVALTISLTAQTVGSLSASILRSITAVTLFLTTLKPIKAVVTGARLAFAGMAAVMAGLFVPAVKASYRIGKLIFDLIDVNLVGVFALNERFQNLARIFGITAVAGTGASIGLAGVSSGAAAAAGTAASLSIQALALGSALVGLLNIVGRLTQAFGVSLVNAARDWLSVAAEAERLQFGLAVAIENFELLTGDTSLSVEVMTDRIFNLSRQTGISVFEMKSAVIQMLDLANITGLTGKQIDELIVRMADFSAVTGESFGRAILGIDQALRDFPLILQSMGLQITEETINQTEFAKSLGKTKDEMSKTEKATASVAAVMDQTIAFSGKAAAVAVATLQGALQTLGGEIQNFTVELGRGVDRVFRPFFSIVVRLAGVIKLLPKEFFNLAGSLTAVVGVLATGLGVLIKWSTAIAFVVIGIKLFNAVLQENFLKLGSLIKRVTGATGAVNTLTGAFRALLAPAIAAATTEVVNFARATRLATLGLFVRAVKGLNQAFAAFSIGGLPAARRELTRTGSGMAAIISRARALSGRLGSFLSIVRRFAPFIGALALVATQLVRVIREQEVLTRATEAYHPALSRARELLLGVSEASDEAAESTKSFRDVLLESGGAIGHISRLFDRTTEGIRLLIGVAFDAFGVQLPRLLSETLNLFRRLRIDSLNFLDVITGGAFTGVFQEEVEEIERQLEQSAATLLELEAQHAKNREKIALQSLLVRGFISRKEFEQRLAALDQLEDVAESEEEILARKREAFSSDFEEFETNQVRRLELFRRIGALTIEEEEKHWREQLEASKVQGNILTEQRAKIYERLLELEEERRDRTVELDRERLRLQEAIFDQDIAKLTNLFGRIDEEEKKRLVQSSVNQEALLRQELQDLDDRERALLQRLDAFNANVAARSAQAERQQSIDSALKSLERFHSVGIKEEAPGLGGVRLIAESIAGLSNELDVLDLPLQKSEEAAKDLIRRFDEGAISVLEFKRGVTELAGGLRGVRLIRQRVIELEKENEVLKEKIKIQEPLGNVEDDEKEILRLRQQQTEVQTKLIRLESDLGKSRLSSLPLRERLEEERDLLKRSLDGFTESEEKKSSVALEQRLRLVEVEKQITQLESDERIARAQHAGNIEEAISAKLDAELASRLEDFKDTELAKQIFAERKAQEIAEFRLSKEIEFAIASGNTARQIIAEEKLSAVRRKSELGEAAANKLAQLNTERRLIDLRLQEEEDAALELGDLNREAAVRITRIQIELERTIQNIKEDTTLTEEQKLKKITDANEIAAVRIQAVWRETQSAIAKANEAFARDQFREFVDIVKSEEHQLEVRLERHKQFLLDLQNAYEETNRTIAERGFDVAIGSIEALQAAFETAIVNLAQGSVRIEEIWRSLRDQLASVFARFVAEYAFAALKSILIQKFMVTAASKASAIIAKLWAPAATLASVATFGGAAAAGAAALAAALLAIQTLVASMTGAGTSLGGGGGGGGDPFGATGDKPFEGLPSIPGLAEGGVVHKESIVRVAEEEPEVIVPLSRLEGLLKIMSTPTKGIEIPAFQKGGLVTKETLAKVGEVPEAIIPLSRFEDLLTVIRDSATTDEPQIPTPQKGGLSTKGILEIIRSSTPAEGEIPALQKGGIVTKETLVRVAEKGPEAIIPLSLLDSLLKVIKSPTQQGGLVSTPERVGEVPELILPLDRFDSLLERSRESTREISPLSRFPSAGPAPGSRRSRDRSSPVRQQTVNVSFVNHGDINTGSRERDLFRTLQKSVSEAIR